MKLDLNKLNHISKLSIVKYDLKLIPRIFTVSYYASTEINNHQIDISPIEINQVLQIVDAITTIESTTMTNVNFNQLKNIPFGRIVGEFRNHSPSTRQPLVEIFAPVN